MTAQQPSALSARSGHEGSPPETVRNSDGEVVLANQPGTPHMPPWTVAELPKPPIFAWNKLLLMVGPGLVMGGAAIGGGEWLTGPAVTARYGGALLWLATLSVVFQVIYNVEISRYTLYSGESIFTGKFRIAPHPLFWVAVYLVLDFGSILPYLASNAAIPLGALIRGKIPDPVTDGTLLKTLGCIIFVSVFIPLCIGGKVYNSIRAIMYFKLVFVLTFLIYLAIMYSTADTWKEIGTGFLKFGNVPVSPLKTPTKTGRRTRTKSPIRILTTPFPHGSTVAALPSICRFSDFSPPWWPSPEMAA